ncbi:MAG: transposase, partial [Clostridiales bacterium]|nr:transposase [Clostridiales bacterium]
LKTLEIYSGEFSADTGRIAITARFAFGSIYIKEQEWLTDEGSVRYIQENPYAQYFLGLKRFHPEPLFEASMMVHFRKRFPASEIIKINEYICLGHWAHSQLLTLAYITAAPS